MPDTKTIAAVYDAYTVAVLFSELDENDEPLDANYNTGDLADEAKQRAMKDVVDFLELLEREHIDWEKYGSTTKLGMDFWFTRNGYGVGFWDRDWREIGDTLTVLCKSYGECYAYVTNNGEIDFL